MFAHSLVMTRSDNQNQQHYQAITTVECWFWLISAVSISTPLDNWRQHRAYDIQAPEVSHFPLLKNAQQQRCRVEGSENKSDFKCLGRGGHLKEAAENREGFDIAVTTKCRRNQNKCQKCWVKIEESRQRRKAAFNSLNIVMGTIQMLFVTYWVP